MDRPHGFTEKNRLRPVHLIPDNKPATFFSHIVVKYLAKPFINSLKGSGAINPAMLSIGSFCISLAASVSLLLLNQNHFYYSGVIPFLLAVSLLLDCYTSEIADDSNDKSIFKKWFHHYLGRIAEMVFYSILGYFSWRSLGQFSYFIMGTGTGFLFNYISLIHAEWESIQLEDLKKNDYRIPGYKNDVLPERVSANTITWLLFHVPIGKAERYMFPIIFLLFDKTDILLFVVCPLAFIQSVLATLAVSNQMSANTPGITSDEHTMHNLKR